MTKTGYSIWQIKNNKYLHMKNKKLKIITIIVVIAIVSYFSYKTIININPNPKYFVGQKIDSLNGVYVYYNGGIGHIEERNLAPDGYNIGLKYQCVEFMKRYYYEHYNHKMPDSYGNAKDFYATDIADGGFNPKRNLIQYSNPSKTPPQEGDIIIFDGHSGNQYGHVAIISKVLKNEIEIIQQNPGPFASSRALYNLKETNGKFEIENSRVLGWLRKR